MTAVVDAASLRRAGREIPLPARLALDDGRELVLEECLRLLPGKRLVARARLRGKPVLAKLYLARRGAPRHRNRELRGLHALHDRGLPTPQLLYSGTAGEAPAILARWLDDARTLADLWQPEAPLEEQLALFRPLVRLLGAMHARGLLQQDIHPGNFLRHGKQLFIIDGDAIESRGNRPLSPRRAADNLGRLLAELSPALDPALDELLDVYHEAGGAPALSRQHLQAGRNRHRDRRMRRFLAKIDRDCTRFQVRSGMRRFTVVRREESDMLAPLLEHPESFMEKGQPLKQGGNSTVVRIALGERELVIKRYNLKNRMVRLRRLPRRSRPWQAWRESLRLEFLGISTPRPLALVRERLGPFHGRAWLVSEYLPGENTTGRWARHEQGPTFPREDLEQLLAVLQRLDEARVTHGDLKASNILWHAGRPWLTDLDAMCRHHSRERFRRARLRDRQRFLENWPEDAPLRRWLHNALLSGRAGG